MLRASERVDRGAYQLASELVEVSIRYIRFLVHLVRSTVCYFCYIVTKTEQKNILSVVSNLSIVCFFVALQFSRVFGQKFWP